MQNKLHTSSLTVDWSQPGQDPRKCFWLMLWAFLLVLMPSLSRTGITHLLLVVSPSSPYSLVPPTRLKDATSSMSTVSQRLSSQVFQGERQNHMPPQLLHPSMLEPTPFSVALSHAHLYCRMWSGWCHTSPAHLQSKEKGNDGTDNTAEHSTPRSKHVMPNSRCLTGWRSGHKLLQFFPSRPKHW